MGSLDGKVAIITGAGRLRGIGRAAALALAELGADLSLSPEPGAILSIIRKMKKPRAGGISRARPSRCGPLAGGVCRWLPT